MPRNAPVLRIIFGGLWNVGEDRFSYKSHCVTKSLGISGGADLAHATRKTQRQALTRMVHVRLAPDLHRRLRLVVAAADTSVQDWVAQLVEKAVNESWPNVAKGEK